MCIDRRVTRTTEWINPLSDEASFDAFWLQSLNIQPASFREVIRAVGLTGWRENV